VGGKQKAAKPKTNHQKKTPNKQKTPPKPSRHAGSAIS